MDLSFALALCFSILAALVFVKFSLQTTKDTHKKKKTLPPGDMGLPWIGETMEFYKAQRRNRLFEDFVQPRMAKYGKTFKTRLMGEPTVVVNGADANRFFLSNEFKTVISSWPSSSVQLMGKHSIMEKQGDSHRFIRSVMATTLGSVGLEAMVPKMCNTIKLHMERNWSGKKEISLYRSTKVLTFTVVFECLLGMEVKPGMSATFEKVLEGVFSPTLNFLGSKFSRAKKARFEIEKMLVDVVRKKRKEMEHQVEGDSKGMLLSRFVAALISGEMNEEEVVDNIVLLVFAAYDTTSFAIAMTFRMLAHNPNCYSLLLQEHLDVMNNEGQGELLSLEDTKKMKYTWQVARESMRLFPPIFGSFRKAIVDIEYDGFTIPQGWKVLWTAYGTHYNAEYFKDPTTFNPGRFEEHIQPYAFLPFGGGPRLCAGYQLAKLNILLFVHYVVTQFNWSLVYPDEQINMDPLPFPSHGMPIQISPKV